MNVCVFCGSSTGFDPAYGDAAVQLAELLCKYNCTLVYGGGNVGLMGILADHVISGGGKVIGIIPDFLMKREVGHTGLTSLEVVGSMHERKKRMADLADAFIALPGGLGTLEEIAEIFTWRQLHLTNAPAGLLNVNLFFEPLIALINKMVAEGFVKQENFSDLKISSNPADLLTLLGVPAF